MESSKDFRNTDLTNEDLVRMWWADRANTTVELWGRAVSLWLKKAPEYQERFNALPVDFDQYAIYKEVGRKYLDQVVKATVEQMETQPRRKWVPELGIIYDNYAHLDRGQWKEVRSIYVKTKDYNYCQSDIRKYHELKDEQGHQIAYNDIYAVEATRKADGRKGWLVWGGRLADQKGKWELADFYFTISRDE